MYDCLFNKLLMKSKLFIAFQSYYQNGKNYEISSFYKFYQILFLSKIIKWAIFEL